MYGLSDLEKFFKKPGVDDTWWQTRVGNPHTSEGLQLLKNHSPINFAERIERPILVTHGSKDDVAPQSQSDEMVKAMQKHKKQVTYFVYPEEPHDYRQPASWDSFWAVAEKFLHQHIGSRFEPTGNSFENANFKFKTGQELIDCLESSPES